MRKPSKGKSLAETHPEVAKQWHPKKNGYLTPYDLTIGSGKLVWWKCNEGEDHVWEGSPHTRYRKEKIVKCSVCSGRTIVKSNSLLILNPSLSQEWHPSFNGDLKPINVAPNSSKKVWWKCSKGDDHVWEANISNRNLLNNGCAICSGHIIVKSNSLQTLNLKLAEQWHPTLNNDLTPLDVGVNFNKAVWWQCPKGEDHVWSESPLALNNNGYDCPVCVDKVIVKSNSLQTLNPKLAEQWHPTLNNDLTPLDVGANSSKKVWWKCQEADDHIWENTVNKRANRGDGCPMCRGKIVVLSNCLQTLNPKLAKEWHPTKNGALTSSDVYHLTTQRVWWKCQEADDHIWDATVRKRGELRDSRASGDGCPFCRGLKVAKSNCLQTLYPKLANEWHPTLNQDVTPRSITPHSHVEVYWKCNKGDDHVWKTRPTNRIYGGTGCPFCDLTPQSKQELTITFELKNLFKNIDPKGFKTRLNGKLRAVDIFLPNLNLCIEFDGSYWHKDKIGIDKIKSEILFKEGFKLIRVREEPLKKIYDTDVISKQPYNGKKVTNDILSMVMSVFDLEDKLVSKIKEYQSKDGLQNEKGLEKYIDKILTEKAEKK
jgi:DNA-directed RNA polymerase subunit RPC12/RpoP